MRIRDGSSDVCSSDLESHRHAGDEAHGGTADRPACHPGGDGEEEHEVAGLSERAEVGEPGGLDREGQDQHEGESGDAQHQLTGVVSTTETKLSWSRSASGSANTSRVRPPLAGRVRVTLPTGIEAGNDERSSMPEVVMISRDGMSASSSPGSMPVSISRSRPAP